MGRGRDAHGGRTAPLRLTPALHAGGMTTTPSQPTSAPVAFVDTETTGLTLDAHIWEVAIIRRDPGLPDVPLHLFVEHDLQKAAKLPEKFRDDHDARYQPDHAVGPRDAARLIHRALSPSPDGVRCHVVGAVPNFDTERLGRLLLAHGLDAPWHYHLIDIENLAVGYLAGRHDASYIGRRRPLPVPLPWRSDDLSQAVGVKPPTEARHTAMGDALWARDLYDRITAARIANDPSTD